MPWSALGLRAVCRYAALSGLGLVALTACARPVEPNPQGPRRIVSLDYCADQYVLRFAQREDIVALSIDAQKPFSYLREAARGLPQARPRAADTLALEPDLVVRSYGGGPNMSGFLERAGVPVVQLGFPDTIDAVREETLRVGAALGNPKEAKAVVREMDLRLMQIRKGEARRTLYLTPGGVVAGEGTMIDDLMQAAGLANFQTRAGWSPIPLERLAYDQPDQVALGFSENNRDRIDAWSAARHPIAQVQLQDQPVIPIEGAWTACGGWFLVEAVEVLAAPKKAAQKAEEAGQ